MRQQIRRKIQEGRSTVDREADRETDADIEAHRHREAREVYVNTVSRQVCSRWMRPGVLTPFALPSVALISSVP